MDSKHVKSYLPNHYQQGWDWDNVERKWQQHKYNKHLFVTFGPKVIRWWLEIEGTPKICYIFSDIVPKGGEGSEKNLYVQIEHY